MILPLARFMAQYFRIVLQSFHCTRLHYWEKKSLNMSRNRNAFQSFVALLKFFSSTLCILTFRFCENKSEGGGEGVMERRWNWNNGN